MIPEHARPNANQSRVVMRPHDSGAALHRCRCRRIALVAGCRERRAALGSHRSGRAHSGSGTPSRSSVITDLDGYGCDTPVGEGCGVCAASVFRFECCDARCEVVEHQWNADRANSNRASRSGDVDLAIDTLRVGCGLSVGPRHGERHVCAAAIVGGGEQSAEPHLTHAT